MAFRYDAGFMKPLRLLLVGFFVLPVLACTSADIRPDAMATGGSAGGTGSGGGGGTGGTNTDASTNDDRPLGGEAGGETGGGGAGGEDGGGGGAAGEGGGGPGGDRDERDGGGQGGGAATGGLAGQDGGGGHAGDGGQAVATGGRGGMAGGTSGQGGMGAGGGGGTSATCVAQPTIGTPLSPTAAGQLVVSELMHATMSPFTDAFGEWFELYNPSPTKAYELQGCKITDNASGGAAASATINTTVVLPPCSYGALAISANPGFTPLYVYGTASGGVKFGNDHDDGVQLICGNGVLIASFHYMTADAAKVSPTYNGHSFSVDPSHFDAVGGTPGTFCAGMTPYPSGGSNYGTPGTANPPCIK